VKNTLKKTCYIFALMKKMRKQNNKKFIAKKTKKKSGEFKTPNFLETTTEKSMM
jgi:hypothetical protein